MTTYEILHSGLDSQGYIGLKFMPGRGIESARGNKELAIRLGYKIFETTREAEQAINRYLVNVLKYPGMPAR